MLSLSLLAIKSNSYVFLDNINRLFHFEREYDREMITDEERTR